MEWFVFMIEGSRAIFAVNGDVYFPISYSIFIKKYANTYQTIWPNLRYRKYGYFIYG